MTKRSVLVLAAALAVGLGPSAEAAAKRVRTMPALQKKDAGTWVGTRAITAASGEVRVPTTEEATALAASLKGMLDRSGAGVTTAKRKNGTRMATLDATYGSVVLTRPTSDGGVETRCVTTFEEAVAFLGLASAQEDQ